MTTIIVLFVIAVVLPFGLRLSRMEGDLPYEIEAAAAALAMLVVVILVLRPRMNRRDAAGPRPPTAAQVGKLKWPRNLSPQRFEAYCETYLRQHGWEVSPARSNAAEGVYLQASNAAGRVVMVCERQAAAVTPLTVRSIASVALALGDARGVVLTQGRVAPVTEQAASAEGVAVLNVTDLPDLARFAVAPPPQAAPPRADSPDAAGPAIPPPP